MVILKKIKGSSLIETMIATVLIVIIFMVASLTLNNLFNNTIKYNTIDIETYVNKLEYQYQHQSLKLPYKETYGGWELSISQKTQAELPVILIEANHPENNRTLKRIIPF
ncbi:hypothetical protein GTQ40_13685 [Flavobacteriaceae bacterium R38]|nr:hypothetical protein [Flavobacteriaceae bacterium R38]